jgi:hypothetical protein
VLIRKDEFKRGTSEDCIIGNRLMSLNLKLVRASEIRKLYIVPQNIPELFACIDSVYGSTDFDITYLDADGDHVTILIQQDLEAAYHTVLAEKRPALKLYLEKKSMSDYDTEPTRQDQAKLEDQVDLVEAVPEAIVIEPNPELLAAKVPIEAESEAQAEAEFVPVNEAEQTKKTDKRPGHKWAAWKAMKAAAKQFKKGFKPCKMFKGCKPRTVQHPQGTLFSEEQVSFIRNIVSEETGQTKPIHTRYTCDSCGVHPIEGVRYNCTVCMDFDFCEACEAKIEHAHPFIKHKTVVAPRCCRAAPQEAVVELDLGNVLALVPEKLQEVVNKFHKMMSNQFKPNTKGLKGRPQAHLTLAKLTEVLPATEYVKTWVLVNKGKVAWPVGTKLVFKRGTVEALNEVGVPPLAPGETAEVSVNVKTPSSSGKAKGIWRFETPDGQVFGIAKCVVMVTEGVPAAEEATEKVQQLTSMGFLEDLAREVLLKAKNDINLAVSMLFRQ